MKGFYRSPIRLWAAFSLVILSISLATGYRASRAARAPQYLFNKTLVLVEAVPVPENEEDAAIEEAFQEGGRPPTTVSDSQAMLVLGLLDGALPAIVLGGIVALLIRIVGALRGRRHHGYHDSRPE